MADVGCIVVFHVHGDVPIYGHFYSSDMYAAFCPGIWCCAMSLKIHGFLFTVNGFLRDEECPIAGTQQDTKHGYGSFLVKISYLSIRS